MPCGFPDDVNEAELAKAKPTRDCVLDATNEIIAEVNQQMKSGGIHLTDLAMKIVLIIEKHKAVGRSDPLEATLRDVVAAWRNGDALSGHEAIGRAEELLGR
jgi:hypothetical protein